MPAFNVCRCGTALKKEAFLAKGRFTSNIPRRKPHRTAMPKRVARAKCQAFGGKSTSLPVRSIVWALSCAPSA
jgi:hypothetical protein